MINEIPCLKRLGNYAGTWCQHLGNKCDAWCLHIILYCPDAANGTKILINFLQLIAFVTNRSRIFSLYRPFFFSCDIAFKKINYLCICCAVRYFISTAQCKTVVSPVCYQWRYCRLALSHHQMNCDM